MRYFVGFVLSLALAISPLGVSAQESDAMSETWRHPHDRRTHPKEREPSPEEPALELEPSDGSESEPYVVDPELSPMSIRRWHPEAFEPAAKQERKFEVEYVTPSREDMARQEQKQKRNKRIAIGVSVSVVLAGFAAGMTGWALSSLNRIADP